MGKYLVVHPDQLQGLPGDGLGAGGDRGDGVTVIQRLAPCHAVVLHVSDRLIIRHAEIRRGHDGFYAAQSLGCSGVDRLDDGMGMRTAQDATDKHAGRCRICAIHRASGHFFDAVGAGRARSNNFEILFCV